LKSKQNQHVVVIIPTTFNRTNLLIERSLKSVYNQTKVIPRRIYIIDDNDDINEFFKIKQAVKKFRTRFFTKKGISSEKLKQGYFQTSVIRNNRTPKNAGAGARNTGAYEAYKNDRIGKKTYLAFLDDDDEWELDYLYECQCSIQKSLIEKNYSKFECVSVITSILRKENNKETIVSATTNKFTEEALCIGNPGLQGSNLFIELNAFWSIGGFDENMESTIDRDFGIRFLEHLKQNEFRYFVTVKRALVIHHAHDKNRVTSNNDIKHKGLDIFYAKYTSRMSNEILQKSLERANYLFDYKNNAISFNENFIIDTTTIKSSSNLKLIIGTTSKNGKNLMELLKSFSYQIENYGNDCTDYLFLILENCNDEYQLRPIVKYFQEIKNIKIKFIPKEQQENDYSSFHFNHLFNQNDLNEKSIAFSRSMLHWYIKKSALEVFKDNFVSWIIDDDCLFYQLFENQNGQTHEERLNYFEKIKKLKNEDIDIILGTVTDAPPLPFMSTLRVQLIDLYYNLTHFVNANPEEQFKPIPNIYGTLKINNPDFYYDLSSRFYNHLETPFGWNTRENNSVTFCKAFKEFLDDSLLLKYETNIFRPITINRFDWDGLVCKDSIYRGGNTLIFNSNLIDNVPNYSPEINLSEIKKSNLRRSDFNWAITQSLVNKAKIREYKIPLGHHRRIQDGTFIIDKNKLETDIHGLSFYRALHNLFKQNTTENITPDNIQKAVLEYKHNISDAIEKMKINNLRVLSLIKLINIRLESLTKTQWYSNEYRSDLNDKILQLKYLLHSLEYEFGKRKFQKHISEIQKNINKINSISFENSIKYLCNNNIKK
jgi:ASC-1-like (ASCH) protein